MGDISNKKPANNLIYIMAALIIAAIAVFGLLCFHYQFVQDDAYISFRYAANFVDGHGLVFNVGERVEGYTNFLWIIGLILFKKIPGLDYVLTARILGCVSGMALYFITAFLLYRHDRNRAVILATGAFVLMLSCAAIPYWSVSGLETAAFAAIVFGTLAAELYKPRLTPILLVAAMLLRPDDAVLFAAILLHRLISDRRGAFSLLLIYILLLAPYGIFKLLYYGSLAPNTFYAKSGLGWDYLQSGWEYTVHFFRTVGVYGLILIPIILSTRALWRRYRPMYLFTIIYVMYVILVGGDVLKVFRFFIPVVSVMFFLFVISLDILLDKIIRKINVPIRRLWLVMAPIIIVFAAASHLLAKGHVDTFLANERSFTAKMHFAADMMKRYMSPSFTIAASTIGVLGYELPDHRLIDMVGLTDSCIARHGETIPGLESTWKERRYNSRYILEQQPDIIMFSTNDKPSAPAEKALFMHSEFRKNYIVSGFHREQGQRWTNFFMKIGNYNIDRDQLLPDAGFVNLLHDALTNLSHGNIEAALDLIMEAANRLPPEEYAFLHYYKGDFLYRTGRESAARDFLEEALAAYPDDCRPRWRLGQLAARVGDTATINRLTDEIRDRQPWLLDFSH